jgi:glycosyltransferase involved in cell wall biosynthesis
MENRYQNLVLFDHQIFSYQQFGGVSRYFAELMKNINPELWDVSLMFSNNEYLKEVDKKISYFNFFKTISFYKKERLMLELGKPYSLYKVAKNNYGVLHLTHYEGYANNATKRPIVMTYHDKLFSSYCYHERTIREQKKCFAHVDKIITVSNNTKNDLISLFGIDEKKIEVIYHGVSKNLYVHGERIIKEKYILFVGARKKYKNFFRLLKAFAQIIKTNMPELKLVCTGKPFDNNELQEIQALGIKKEQINSRFYSDEELQNLYQNAELFVFPSEYEGFGFPLLEAMSNNCPVVCSNASCFPEIAGNAAEYFNSLDIDDIFAALKKVLFSTDMRKKLVENGKNRCEEFSWEKSAQKHINLYESLI